MICIRDIDRGKRQMVMKMEDGQRHVRVETKWSTLFRIFLIFKMSWNQNIHGVVILLVECLPPSYIYTSIHLFLFHLWHFHWYKLTWKDVDVPRSSFSLVCLFVCCKPAGPRVSSYWNVSDRGPLLFLLVVFEYCIQRVANVVVVVVWKDWNRGWWGCRRNTRV